MDNPETMATWGTRRRMKSNKTKQYNTRMDNLETMTTLGIQDTGWSQTKQNNTTQEWTIQRQLGTTDAVRSQTKQNKTIQLKRENLKRLAVTDITTRKYQSKDT